MSMKKKKRVLNIVFVYLYLMYIGATFPVKAQSNYKVKLTGIVYEYDQNNKLLPLEFAAVSIPESSLGTTSNENGRYTLEYLQPIITQYFIDNKSEIWLLFLIAHSKR